MKGWFRFLDEEIERRFRVEVLRTFDGARYAGLALTLAIWVLLSTVCSLSAELPGILIAARLGSTVMFGAWLLATGTKRGHWSNEYLPFAMLMWGAVSISLTLISLPDDSHPYFLSIIMVGIVSTTLLHITAVQAIALLMTCLIGYYSSLLSEGPLGAPGSLTLWEILFVTYALSVCTVGSVVREVRARRTFGNALRLEGQRQEIEQLANRLQDLDSNKSALVRMVSDETSASLTLLTTQLDVVTKAMDGREREALSDHAEHSRSLAYAAATRMERLGVWLSLVGGHRKGLDEVCRVDALLDEATWDHDCAIDSYGDGLSLLCDRAAIVLCINELLKNAALAAHPSPRIVLSSELRGNSVRICVTDNGPGFGEMCLDEACSLEPDVARGGGETRFGLRIVHAVAEAHGGRFSLERTGQTTIAAIDFPQWRAVAPLNVRDRDDNGLVADLLERARDRR